MAMLTDTTSQLLTFRSGQTLFSMNISHVVEIVGTQVVTRVPTAPPFISGVTNIRGRVLPIIDLAVKFGAPPTAAGPQACVVIVNVPIGSEETQLGLLVDSVEDLLDVAPEDVAPPPSFGTPVDVAYLHGLVPLENTFVPLLDIPKILSASELIATREAAAVEPA